MKLLSVAGLAFAASLAFASASQAGIVYDNGAPTDTGNEATAWAQAEDFTLTTTTTLTGAGVYMGFLNGIGAWDGTLDYMIFSPLGTLVANGAAQNLTVTNTGNSWYDNAPAYLAEFDFEAGFTADAGTRYWLGVHLSSNYDRDDIYWISTAANGTYSGTESFGGIAGPWAYNSREHAFFLTAADPATDVPAPAALSLLGLGLAGLGLMRRRKP